MLLATIISLLSINKLIPSCLAFIIPASSLQQQHQPWRGNDDPASTSNPTRRFSAYSYIERRSIKPLVIMQAKKKAWTPPENEFSRTIDLDDITRKPTFMRISAEEGERAAVAERFEFENLKHLSANISISRPCWGTLLAKGELKAGLDRYCVVTGEKFNFEFETDFSTYIKEVGGAVPLYDANGLNSEENLLEDLEDEDYDDEVEAGTELDVGEIAAQYLYLNMPPYPTMPGKSLDDIADEVIFEMGGDAEEEAGGGGKKGKSKPSW